MTHPVHSTDINQLISVSPELWQLTCGVETRRLTRLFGIFRAWITDVSAIQSGTFVSLGARFWLPRFQKCCGNTSEVWAAFVVLCRWAGCQSATAYSTQGKSLPCPCTCWKLWRDSVSVTVQPTAYCFASAFIPVSYLPPTCIYQIYKAYIPITYWLHQHVHQLYTT